MIVEIEVDEKMWAEAEAVAKDLNINIYGDVLKHPARKFIQLEK